MLLRVLTGRRAGKVVAIVGQEFVIGSSRGCDLVLPDDGVAARHAVVRTRPGAGCFVEDLGTDEGTFVAGRRIRSSVQVVGDEELCFGRTYAALAPGSLRPRRRRMAVVVAVVGVVGIALVAAVVGVVLPRNGGGAEVADPVAPVAVEPLRQETPVEPEPPVETPERPPAETPERDADAGPIVVREDFSDRLSGWETVDAPDATGGYSDGEYVVGVGELGTYVTVDSGVAAERPVISVTVRNAGRSPSAGFGIICRYTSEQDFVALVAGTDGRAAILRRDTDGLTVISGTGAWTASGAIPVNAPTYKLRADCRRSTVALFVDGGKVVSATAPLSAGDVGLFAAGKAEFHFDNVVIVDSKAGG